MKQLTLAMVSLSATPGQHGGRRFLAEMERIVPRPVFCALIHPSDPKRNGR